MNKLLLLGLGVFVFITQILAQDRTVTGVIVDQNDEPIAAATVKIVGANASTVTDSRGYLF
jgi:hypothetical protein